MEERWTQSRPAGRPAIRPGGLLLAVLAGALVCYAAATARYEAYDLGFSAGNVRAMVESWSVELPLGYRLAWWRTTPPGPQDGPRLLRSVAED